MLALLGRAPARQARSGSGEPMKPRSSTIPRARTCGSRAACSGLSTGLAGTPDFSKRASHSSRSRLRRRCATSGRSAGPAAIRAGMGRPARRPRPSSPQSARQKWASSTIPSVSQRPSRARNTP
ncbi:MAG: hypothetical protein M5U28_41495 [Sandaracinaceae bacterium]|nr:hypothetical protein [Sandaracinaceae bacterium]